MTPGVDAMGMEDVGGRTTAYTASYDGLQLREVLMEGKSKADAGGGCDVFVSSMCTTIRLHVGAPPHESLLRELVHIAMLHGPECARTQERHWRTELEAAERCSRVRAQCFMCVAGAATPRAQEWMNV